MKILAFSDWRTQPFNMLNEIIEHHKPDAILYAGDDLNRFIGLEGNFLLKTADQFFKFTFFDSKINLMGSGRISKGAEQLIQNIIGKRKTSFLDQPSNTKVPFYYVNGNDDNVIKYEGEYYLQIHRTDSYRGLNKGYSCLKIEQTKIKVELISTEVYNTQKDDCGIYVQISPRFGNFSIGDINIFGFECKQGLTNKIIGRMPNTYSDIYLTHLPPFGSVDLSVRFGMKHIGSKKILKAVNKYRPKLVICGHSHIWGGTMAKIEDTIVINVSSHDSSQSDGNFALIDTENWSVEMKCIKGSRPVRGISTIKQELRIFKPDISNYYDEMEKFNTEKYWADRKRFNEKYLEPLYNPDCANPEKIDTCFDNLNSLGINADHVKERIKSLSWEKPKILKKITINPEKHAFIDVETGLLRGDNPGKLWLIGLWYKGEIKQFIIPGGKKAFKEYLKKNGIKSLASWTRYDHKSLNSVHIYQSKKLKFIDACQRTANCVIWHTYNLHDLYDAFFQTKSEETITGVASGLYADHLIIPKKNCPYCPPREEIIERIKKRNRLDLTQMVQICRYLWNKSEK